MNIFVQITTTSFSGEVIHYIYKRHCINCNVQLHSMIAVKDINRYELHFRQFMLMANTVTSLLL